MAATVAIRAFLANIFNIRRGAAARDTRIMPVPYSDPTWMTARKLISILRQHEPEEEPEEVQPLGGLAGRHCAAHPVASLPSWGRPVFHTGKCIAPCHMNGPGRDRRQEGQEPGDEERFGTGRPCPKAV